MAPNSALVLLVLAPVPALLGSAPASLWAPPLLVLRRCWRGVAAAEEAAEAACVGRIHDQRLVLHRVSGDTSDVVLASSCSK